MGTGLSCTNHARVHQSRWSASDAPIAPERLRRGSHTLRLHSLMSRHHLVGCEPVKHRGNVHPACSLQNTGPKRIRSRHGLLTTVCYKLGADTPPCYALEGAVWGDWGVEGTASPCSYPSRCRIYAKDVPMDSPKQALFAAIPGAVYMPWMRPWMCQWIRSSKHPLRLSSIPVPDSGAAAACVTLAGMDEQRVRSRPNAGRHRPHTTYAQIPFQVPWRWQAWA